MLKPDRGANRMAQPLKYRPGESNSAETAVDQWVARLINRPIDQAKRQTLIDAMNGRTDDSTMKTLIQLIVSMPDYQLC
jgi:hypothetical protein